MINRVISHSGQSAKDQPRTGRNRRGLKRLFFGVAVLFGIVLVGCSQGSYPVDIFYEQHYQQSYRSHEPPRLNGAAEAVAFYPAAASDSLLGLERGAVRSCAGRLETTSVPHRFLLTLLLFLASDAL